MLFWREVERRPNDRLCIFFDFSRDSEIGQHRLIPVDQHVLRLNVSVDDMLLMHVVNSGTQLTYPFYHNRLTRQASLSESIEQLTALAILHNNVVRSLIRERAVEPYDVRVRGRLEHGDLDVLCLRVRG